MNAKIYNGNVQPNHKEYKIWVNDEGIIKTWNGTEWVEQSGDNGESGGSGSGNSESESSWVFYKFSNTAPNEMKLGLLGMLSHVFSYTSETGKYVCAPSGSIAQISTSKNTINAIGVDCKASVRLNTGEVLTMDKYASYATGATDIKDALNQAGLTEITKDEFYNLEV